MDRAIISLFIIPIQRDIQISDTQISLLVGFAFGAFNALFACRGEVDRRGRRRTIAAIGIAVWSVAASCCGLATNFWQLFFGRVGVGAGEASVTPAECPCCDFFRPSAVVWRWCVLRWDLVGGGCALISEDCSGRARRSPSSASARRVAPLLAVVLILVGALGLLVAPLTMMIREPERLDGGRGRGRETFHWPRWFNTTKHMPER